MSHANLRLHRYIEMYTLLITMYLIDKNVGPSSSRMRNVTSTITLSLVKGICILAVPTGMSVPYLLQKRARRNVHVAPFMALWNPNSPEYDTF